MDYKEETFDLILNDTKALLKSVNIIYVNRWMGDLWEMTNDLLTDEQAKEIYNRIKKRIKK